MASDRRLLEGGAIFGTHGILDGVSTALLTWAIGAEHEPNPIMRSLLREHIGLGVGVMLLAVGTASLLWIVSADRYSLPSSFALLVSLVGLAISIGNFWLFLSVIL